MVHYGGRGFTVSSASSELLYGVSVCVFGVQHFVHRLRHDLQDKAVECYTANKLALTGI